jgi:electron transfer flavoprotein beta subunit
MDIIVCIKQIYNPETPPKAFRIDVDTNSVMAPPGDHPFVINPFDEQAVDAALRIKDVHGAKVTALCLGDASAKAILKHAMAMGADDGILLDVPDLEDYDSYLTAFVLSSAINKIGQYDLIFCGRQAGDWDNSQVGLGIAELLGIPSINPAKKAEVVDGKVHVDRVLDDGYEILEVSTPCLITISSEIGLPRYATLPGIMAAAKRDITTWNNTHLGLEPTKLDSSVARTRMLKLFVPENEANCTFYEAETLEEAAVELSMKLREENII